MKKFLLPLLSLAFFPTQLNCQEFNYKKEYIKESDLKRHYIGSIDFNKYITDGEKNNRWDLVLKGETQMAPLKQICSIIKCKIDINKDFLTITHKKVIDTWQFDTLSIKSSNEPLFNIQLPVYPIKKYSNYFFPAKLIIERGGFTTYFDKEENRLHIFDLADDLKTIKLKHERTIEGSSLKLSYFVNAHESKDFIYIKIDNSKGLFKFNKKDWAFKHILNSDNYGESVNFIKDKNKIYLITTSGAIIKYVDEKLDKVLTGLGNKSLSIEGDSISFDEFNNSGITQLLKHPSKNILYGFNFDLGKFYEININSKQIKLIKHFKSHNFKSLNLFGDLPILSGKQLVAINPENGNIYKSSCYEKLIQNDRIYGIKFIPRLKKWIIINSSKRDILEANINFDKLGINQKCGILKSTHITRDEIAFLNRFGSIEYEDGIDRNQLLIMDSDGYNLIRYYLDEKKPEYITKNDLTRKSKLMWVGPTAAFEKDNFLYILANLTHQVSRISLKDYSSEIFLGSGIPTRGAASGFALKKAQLGYPVSMKLFNNKIWIGDAFGRRVLFVNKKNKVDQLFPPPHWNEVGSVTGLTKLKDDIFFVDHTFGKLHKFSINKPYKGIKWIAGNTPKEAPSDSEMARRYSSRMPVSDMTSMKEVVFGLPISIDSVDRKLYISDTYRSGIWEIDLNSKIAKPVSGMNSASSYHFGSFPGNEGFSGKRLRLASPRFIYSEDKNLFFVTAEFHQKGAFIRKDFEKACAIEFDIPLKTIAPGTILKDGRIVLLDSTEHKVHFFKPPNLSCLSKIIDDKTIKKFIKNK